MKMNNRVIAIIIGFILVIQGNTIVHANPLAEQLQNQLQRDRNQLVNIEEQLEELEAQIEEFDVQIEGILRLIDDNKKQINQTEKDIRETEQQIKRVEEEIELGNELLGKRLRTMYMAGSGGYLSVLFQSKNMGDFLSRLEWINRIVEFDRKIVQELEDKEKELELSKESLHKKLKELVDLKVSNDEKLARVKKSMNEQKKLIEEVKKQERILASRVRETQNLVDAALRQIQQVRDSVPKYNTSRGAAPISDNTIIAFASNFLGTPYVWGGTTPNPGFDCSGFTQYVFAHFGIKLGRTTWDQIKDGVYVPREQLQPGDLVFYGKGGNPTHMGIYVGNDSYMHAPRTGEVVKISPYNRRDYITARRVWK
jgi:peptidoglycan DL-endopeptidase CwlO